MVLRVLTSRRPRALGLLAGVGVLAVLAACGDPAAKPAKPSGVAVEEPPRAVDYPTSDASWGKFHSKRFQLTVPLPDGPTWKIDDHRQAELIATHAPTSARLSILLTQEEGLMNHERCEERAREMGWLGRDRPSPTPRERGRERVRASHELTTVDDQLQTGPDAYDSRVWVALDPDAGDAAVEGHVFLFGAFLRRCLLVHYVTRVPSSKDEGVLASRLAVAGGRIVKAIAIDPLRTTDSATVPRDKPDVRR